jgi:hypothetical protein
MIELSFNFAFIVESLNSKLGVQMGMHRVLKLAIE